MPLVDVICLLSTHNVAFVRFLTEIIRLRAQISDYTIKKVRFDNAGKFMSQAFNDYYINWDSGWASYYLCAYTKCFDWITD